VKTPIWIEERVVLALHDQSLVLDGGPAGIRDRTLLASALARAQQLHAYGTNPDIADLAAAYTAGIVRNHPFIDGNKRTGFVTGILFLELNGHAFNATEEPAAQAVLDLASKALDEAGYAQFLRTNSKRTRQTKGKA
jgi:death-on-curing protein